jgi:1,4-dihydroxy-2-naphthoate polyprenyltransferase
MKLENPSFFQIIRAPFLSSIYTPLIIGTLAAVAISESFSILGFIFVMIMGTGLHIATNVYNDIYDTIQGTDKVNIHRNEFSGGSGILLDRPDLMSKLYSISRWSLVVAFFATVILTFLIDRNLWPHLWVLYLLSVFFSKFYTAAPVKLAYRGLGEFFVWLAFGPMAILVAAVGQNVAFDPVILVVMPITGISTLSILLIGQMIDLQADKAGGKLGVAARLGTNTTKWIYFLVQLLLVINIIILALLITKNGWPILVTIIPYFILFPKIWNIVKHYHENPERLKKAAGYNVQLHLLFSICFILGWGMTLLI